MASIERRVLANGTERFTVRVFAGRSKEGARAGKRDFVIRTVGSLEEATALAAELEALKGAARLGEAGSVMEVPGIQRCPIASSPRCSRVYFLTSGTEIVYIGKTTAPWPYRVLAHRHRPRLEFDEVFYIDVPPALLTEVETRWVAHFKPKYNKYLFDSGRGRFYIRDGRPRRKKRRPER